MAKRILLFTQLFIRSFLVGFQFSAKELQTGKPIQIQNSKSKKGLVLAFLSAKCPCSASHEQELKRLKEEYKDFDFYGIHSNQDESQEMAKRHFKEANLGFALVSDHGAKIADQLKALKTPHVFVFSESGNLAYQGGIDDSHKQEEASKHYLREVLAAMKLNKELPYKETRTLGCVIRR